MERLHIGILAVGPLLDRIFAIAVVLMRVRLNLRHRGTGRLRRNPSLRLSRLRRLRGRFGVLDVRVDQIGRLRVGRVSTHAVPQPFRQGLVADPSSQRDRGVSFAGRDGVMSLLGPLMRLLRKRRCHGSCWGGHRRLGGLLSRQSKLDGIRKQRTRGSAIFRRQIHDGPESSGNVLTIPPDHTTHGAANNSRFSGQRRERAIAEVAISRRFKRNAKFASMGPQWLSHKPSTDSAGVQSPPPDFQSSVSCCSKRWSASASSAK